MQQMLNKYLLLIGLVLLTARPLHSAQLLCYGDSITQGTHIDGKYTINSSWVNLLQMISADEWTCINAGRSGRKTADIAELAPILDQQTQVDGVIYFLGINDLPHEPLTAINRCLTNTATFIQQIRAKFGPKMPIYILGLPGLDVPNVTAHFKNIGYDQTTHNLVEPLNQAYAKLAKQKHCAFINLYGLLKPQDFTDGLHPNLNGQFKIAETVFRKISKTPPKIRIACVGDSITYGMGVANREINCYPAKLQTAMGDRFSIQNFGVSARTLLKKGDRPYWREKAFKDAKAFYPNLVLIKLGTNDAKTHNWKHKAEFASDYQALIQSFQNLPSQPQVMLLTPAPVIPTETNKRWTIFKDVVAHEVAPEIAKIAKKAKIPVIDIQQNLPADFAYFVADGVHPNANGAAKIAEIVEKALKSRKMGHKK